MTYTYAPTIYARNVSLCPPRIYMNKDEFIKFVEKYRDEIKMIIHTKTGTLASFETYIAFYKDFIAICKSKVKLPIEVDIEAKKVSGIWI